MITAERRFKKSMLGFYAILVGVLCFLWATARWQYHRQPRITEKLEKTHVDIDGECIITKIRTVTTSKAVGFPRVETTVSSDTNVLVGRDSHWFRKLADIIDELPD